MSGTKRNASLWFLLITKTDSSCSYREPKDRFEKLSTFSFVISTAQIRMFSWYWKGNFFYFHPLIRCYLSYRMKPKITYQKQGASKLGKALFCLFFI